MTRRVRVWGPAWATMVLIFVLSSMSGLGPIPGGVDDGVAHALQYAVLAALLLRGLAGARWRGVKVRAAALAVLLATLYGVTDEAHQWFVPGRTAEVTDLVADALGAAVAAGVICGWSIVRRS
ncbi:MAG: VanZ family protein [Vicinamibacterales bacterium]|nr:VanZ family protein [Vicinamibacterales bacterium]